MKYILPGVYSNTDFLLIIFSGFIKGMPEFEFS